MKTRTQVKREFDRKGESISDWAKKNGFDRNRVYQVLNGHVVCRRGQCHDIAVALGVKDGDRRNAAA